MSLSKINIMLCLIISFIPTEVKSGFMDDSPSCQDFDQSPAGPLNAYEIIYAEIYKRNDGAHPKLMDQQLLSEHRMYPRCGHLGPPGASIMPVEGVVEQSDLVWPWLVRFSSDLYCFGVFISPRWIITTASCIKMNLVTIRRPTYSRRGKAIHNSNFRLVEFYNRDNYEFDVALVGVKEYAYTQPACLPMKMIPGMPPDKDCFLIGYQPGSEKLLFQMKVCFNGSFQCILEIKKMSISSKTNTCLKPCSDNAVFPDFARTYAGLPVNCYYGFAWHVVALTIPKQSLQLKNFLVVSNLRNYDQWIRQQASK